MVLKQQPHLKSVIFQHFYPSSLSNWASTCFSSDCLDVELCLPHGIVQNDSTGRCAWQQGALERYDTLVEALKSLRLSEFGAKRGEENNKRGHRAKRVDSTSMFWMELSACQ